MFEELIVKMIRGIHNMQRNVAIEANEDKPLDERAKWLKKFFEELVEDAPMVPRELAEMLMETVNWRSIIENFEGEEPYEDG
jgi:hypothetical protein